MRSTTLRGRRTAWGSAAAACLVLPTFLTQGCEPGVRLETQTFELQHLNPGEALEMVGPYVYEEREAAPGEATGFSSGITVRETPESLRRIAAVIDRYDRPKPGVRLHFQVIEADGFTETDDRIADVREALDELFRFDGYRLVSETQMALMQGTSAQQAMPTEQFGLVLHGQVHEVRGSGRTGSVVVEVHLEPQNPWGPRISTTLAVPVGETVILGSSRPRTQDPTTILTVRPEFVPLPNSSGGS